MRGDPGGVCDDRGVREIGINDNNLVYIWVGDTADVSGGQEFPDRGLVGEAARYGGVFGEAGEEDVVYSVDVGFDGGAEVQRHGSQLMKRYWDINCGIVVRRREKEWSKWDEAQLWRGTPTPRHKPDYTENPWYSIP